MTDARFHPCCNIPTHECTSGVQGLTGLHYAAGRGQAEVVNFLLQNGACAYQKDYDVSMRPVPACCMTTVLSQPSMSLPQSLAIAILLCHYNRAMHYLCCHVFLMQFQMQMSGNMSAHCRHVIAAVLKFVAYMQGESPEFAAREAAVAQPNDPISDILLGLFRDHKAMAHVRRSCKYKQQKADELAQLRSQHQDKIKALQALRSPAVMTALCCLQLTVKGKPGLPQPLVQQIATSLLPNRCTISHQGFYAHPLSWRQSLHRM